ncbi:MAG: DUF192 domain-containing protein [Anaerolineae bacterium]|nr:DUF192 domain-containing protein [Anaerolineae bacterium]
MHIYNETRQINLATRPRVADNFWTRGRGLIGTRALQPGDALIIRPCKGVHTWFMSYPIDVIYVDEHDRVVDITPAMRPWRIGRPRLRARYVIELPAGTVQRSGTQIGDQLRLTDK